MEKIFIESFAYVLPAIVTGLVTYYIFSGFIKNRNSEKKIELLHQKRKDSLPIKLQAYERMLLFCDRIKPTKLFIRVKPISEDSKDYIKLLIANIEQEFEHNLVQQIYITEESWSVIVTTKNTIINKLKIAAENFDSANSLRENVLLDFANENYSINSAISIIKNEVKNLL